MEDDKIIAVVPISEKLLLTIKEAAAYSNIGINKLDAMLREEDCPFVLFIGRRRLVKRKEFEEYLSKRFAI
nr:excisionase [uncultured Agathobaculum sp.]